MVCGVSLLEFLRRFNFVCGWVFFIFAVRSSFCLASLTGGGACCDTFLRFAFCFVSAFVFCLCFVFVFVVFAFFCFLFPSRFRICFFLSS